MKKGWEVKRLGEIATFSQGIQVGLKQQKYEPEEGYIRFIRIIDYTQNTNNLRYVKDPGKRYYVNDNDIVMVRYGTPGLIGRGKFGVIANNLFKIKVNVDNLSDDYLSYYLSQYTIQKYLNTQGSATMPALNFKQLSQVVVMYPVSLSEQERIVKKLDSAFAEIDKAKANIKKNIVNAEELFQSKLDEVFSQKGEGWEVKRLGDVCKKTQNLKWNNTTLKYQYIDLTSVSRETLKIENTHKINRENAPGRAKKIVKTNDVIFATTRPTLKRVTIIDEDFNNQICSTGFVVLRGLSESVISKILFYYLQTSNFMTCMEKLQRGASYPAVTDKDVKNHTIRIPSLPEQERIVKVLDAVFAEIEELKAKYKRFLTESDELMKSILEKAFSGEL